MSLMSENLEVDVIIYSFKVTISGLMFVVYKPVQTAEERMKFSFKSKACIQFSNITYIMAMGMERTTTYSRKINQ